MVNKFLTKTATLAERNVFLYGFTGLLCATLIATFSQTHFDRILMPHQSYTPFPFYVPFTEIVILVLTFSVILWITARFWSTSTVPLLSMVNRQLFARIPLCIPPLFFLFPTVQDTLFTLTNWWTGGAERPTISPFMIGLIIGIIITQTTALYLFIRISFQGFISVGSLDKKSVKISYLGSLLLAEIISNTVIVRLFIA